MRGDHNSVSESVIGKVQAEQRKHPQLCKVINHLEKANLPEDSGKADWIVCRASQNHFIVNGVLYFEPADSQGKRRLVVPQHLHREHGPVYSGHFSVKKLMQKLSAMYSTIVQV